MASLHLQISGMSCSHCQAKVQHALQGVEGVYAASVDLTAGSADVDTSDAVSTDQLVAAVTRAGYRASVAAQ
jgi:copper chaperone CopZ